MTRNPACLRNATAQIADVQNGLVLVRLIRIRYAHKPVGRAGEQEVCARVFRGPVKVYGGNVIRVGGRMLPERRGRMSWVPVSKRPSAQGKFEWQNDE
jgi:hypothetical protein